MRAAQYEFAGGELFAVVKGPSSDAAAVAARIDEASQLLGDVDHGGSDGLGVEPHTSRTRGVIPG